MDRQGGGVAQASKSSLQPKPPKKMKLVAKFTNFDSDDDNAPLSSKFKNLKSDEFVTVVVIGGDIGQAPSKAINTDGASSKKPMIKRKRLVKVDQVKQATNTDKRSGPEVAAISQSQRSNKDAKVAATPIAISDSPLKASKKLKKIEAISDQVQNIMSDIQRRRTLKSKYKRPWLQGSSENQTFSKDQAYKNLHLKGV